jgi:hypothetical protein
MLPVLGAVVALAGALTGGSLIGSFISNKMTKNDIGGGALYEKTHKGGDKKLNEQTADIAKKYGYAGNDSEELTAIIKAKSGKKTKSQIDNAEKQKDTKKREKDKETRAKEHAELIKTLKEQRGSQVAAISDTKKIDKIKTNADDLPLSYAAKGTGL